MRANEQQTAENSGDVRAAPRREIVGGHDDHDRTVTLPDCRQSELLFERAFKSAGELFQL